MKIGGSDLEEYIQMSLNKSLFALGRFVLEIILTWLQILKHWWKLMGAILKNIQISMKKARFALDRLLFWHGYKFLKANSKRMKIWCLKTRLFGLNENWWGRSWRKCQISCGKTRFALGRFVLETILTWLQILKSEF